jgi:surface antigen
MPDLSGENQRGIDMTMKALVGATLLAISVAGCAPDSGPRETSGALIGGVAGGLLGNTIGHGNGRAAATIVGAALGAVVGAEIGRNLDERDRRYAADAAEEGLRDNRVARWDNPESGHRGEFRPRRTYTRYDSICRDYENTVWIDGEPELVEGTACQRPDGTWRIVD